MVGSHPLWVWLKSQGRKEVLVLESYSLWLPSLLERGIESEMLGKAFSSPTGIGDSLQVPGLSILLQNQLILIKKKPKTKHHAFAAV